MRTIPKTLTRIVGVTTATIGLVALTGCVSSPDRSAGRMLDDKMISSKVKKELDHAPVYKFDDVRVNTYRGVVQLSGFVETDEQRNKAAEIAKNVGWVREVINNISIKPREESVGRAPGERETSVGAGANRTYSTPRPVDQNPNP